MNKIAEKAIGSAGAAVRALNPNLFHGSGVTVSRVFIKEGYVKDGKEYITKIYDENPVEITTAAAHNAPQVGHYELRQLPPHKNPLVETARPQGKTLCEVFAAEGKRIRQGAKPLLNKLETEFYESLKHYHPGATIWKQALRWKLGNGIWYKPDFVAFTAFYPEGYPKTMPPVKQIKLTAWEVKGPHAFRGGFENLKVAASLYPEVRWVLVWKEDGAWKQQEVLP